MKESEISEDEKHSTSHNLSSVVQGFKELLNMIS